MFTNCSGPGSACARASAEQQETVRRCIRAGMVEETLEQKLKRHEDALSLCIVEIEKLRAENERLKANASAHQTLQAIYRNEAESSTTRVRAAQAALSHESAPL